MKYSATNSEILCSHFTPLSITKPICILPNFFLLAPAPPTRLGFILRQCPDLLNHIDPSLPILYDVAPAIILYIAIISSYGCG